MNGKWLAVAMGWMLLTGCAGVEARAASGEAGGASRSALAMTATPTVGWEATAIVAQSTADAAVRQHDALRIAEAQERNSANELEKARIWMTATYAPTSIPLTMTANAAVIEAANMRLQEVRINATHEAEAPQLMRETKDAEVYDARVDFWVNVWARAMTGLFMLAIPIILWLVKRQPQVIREVEKSRPVGIASAAHRNDMGLRVDVVTKGDGAVSGRFLNLPCSESMLTEFAEGIVGGLKKLRFNDWEGRDTLWTRKSYAQMRVFLLDVKFASLLDNGMIALTDEGQGFLRGWLDTRSLPHRYEFMPEEDDFTVINAHADGMRAVEISR